MAVVHNCFLIIKTMFTVKEVQTIQKVITTQQRSTFFLQDISSVNILAWVHLDFSTKQ